MKVFGYKIKLIDPLFYSKEGLSGAISPKYLHATALNYSVAYALGINPEAQPYVVSDESGSRNIPRYINSIASEDFYFTPGRLVGNIRYMPEIAKGDDDDFVKLGYGASTGKAEVLKASQLFSIPPENIFEGFLITKKEMAFPSIIRLGSFRGKAFLELKEVRVLRDKNSALVAHPVDPLVSKILKGLMIGMFPYPIIENAVCERCIEIKDEGFTKFVALPDDFDFSENSIKKSSQSHIAIV